jgi:hypothetical protein
VTARASTRPTGGGYDRGVRRRLLALLPLVLIAWFAARGLQADDRPLPLRVWTFRLGGTELGLEVADLDADGRQDLAIAHMTSTVGLERTVSTFLHAASTGQRFAQAPSWTVAVPADACAFLAGDFSPRPGGELLFLCPSRLVLAQGHGDLVELAQLRGFFDYPENGGLPVWDLAPDLDGDGLPEVLVPTKEGYELYGRTKDTELALRSTLAVPAVTRFGPAFESQLLNRFLTATTRLRRLVVADVDGDRRKDLVAYRDKGLARFLQRPDGTFPPRPDAEEPLKVVQESEQPGQEAKEGSEAFANVRLGLEDVDMDGLADLIATRTLGEIGMFETLRTQQVVFRGRPGGFDEERPVVLINVKGVSADPVFVDWNGDGKKDLILSSYRMDLLTNVKRALVESMSIGYMVYLRQAEGDWFDDEPDLAFDVDLPLTALEKRGGAQPVDLTADVDGDRTRDMVRRSENGSIIISFGERREGLFGGFGFRDGTLQVGVPRGEPPQPVDLDGDGKDELLLEPFGGEDEAARVVRVVGVER